MSYQARKKASADAWSWPTSQDGEPLADAAAQQGNNRRPGGRLTTRLLGGCAGSCLVLLLSCVILSVAFPVASQTILSALKATIKNIGTERPYRTDALPTRMTLWQGRLYATGPFGSTGVYAPDTGKQLSTFPGVVVGHDEQLLYIGLGRVPVSVFAGRASIVAEAPARLPLIAQDERGTRLWTFPVGAREDADTKICQVESSGDLVYVEFRSQIVALDATDGSMRWSYQYDSSDCSLGVQLVLASQALYLLDRNQVIALSARDGSQRWSHAGTVRQIVDDGQLAYLVGERSLTVLTASSGTFVWQENVGVTVYDDLEAHSRAGGVLVNGQVVYMSNEVGQITARRAATGALLWRGDARQGTSANLTGTYLLGARDGILYTLQDNPGWLAALSGATGHVLWSVANDRLGISDVPSLGTALVGATRDLLYLATGPYYTSSGFSYGSSYRAVDRSSGQLRWRQEAPDASSDPLFDGQLLYSASLLHYRQVNTSLYSSRDVANCSDIADFHSMSAASGASVWQRTTSFPCTSQDSYF